MRPPQIERKRSNKGNAMLSTDDVQQCSTRVQGIHGVHGIVVKMGMRACPVCMCASVHACEDILLHKRHTSLVRAAAEAHENAKAFHDK
jgi:hypothetical protein